MDWLTGKSTGNHRFPYKIWVFPICFPLSQSMDCVFFLSTTSSYHRSHGHESQTRNPVIMARFLITGNMGWLFLSPQYVFFVLVLLHHPTFDCIWLCHVTIMLYIPWYSYEYANEISWFTPMRMTRCLHIFLLLRVQLSGPWHIHFRLGCPLTKTIQLLGYPPMTKCNPPWPTIGFGWSYILTMNNSIPLIIHCNYSS